MVGLCRVTTRRVDGAQCTRNGGNRLHTGPYSQNLTGRHAAFDASGARGETGDTVVAWNHFIVGFRAGGAGGVETISHFHALNCLNTHQRSRQTTIQAPIPLDVGAKPWGQPVHDDFDHAPEGVAVFMRGVDPLDHFLRRFWVGTPHRVSIDRVALGERRGWNISGHFHFFNRHCVAQHGHTELAQKRLRHRAKGHPSRGFPRAGPLQHGPRVLKAILLHPRKVGVAGAGTSQRGRSRAAQLLGIHRPGIHDFFPFWPLGVADAKRNRSALRDAVSKTTRDRQLVRLELHPSAATVTQAPALQGVLNLLFGHLDTSGHAFEGGH